jgi:alpha-glucosidase (family GH31 glycosyl hydrolase)
MGLGDQNLPMAFSGATFQAWDTLAYQVNLTSRAASAALQLWSHDIGMFHRGGGADSCVRGDGNVSDPLAAELYLRSLQAAVFWPAMRTHCRFCERRVWLYESYSEQMMAAMRLRHALLPTLYSGLADWSIGVGPAPIRALFADYPSEDQAYLSAPTQFQWGRPDGALVVSPFTKPQHLAGSQSMWLPAGRWCTFTVTAVPDCSLLGPSTFSFEADAATIPAVAPVGTLLAMQDGRTPPAEAVATVVRWAILGAAVAKYPAQAMLTGAATLFEDDGISLPAAAGNITTRATSAVHIGVSGSAVGVSINITAIASTDDATADLVGRTVGASRRHDVELWGLGPAATFKAAIDGQTIPECASVSQQAPCWFSAAAAAPERPPHTTVVQVELPTTSGTQSTIEATW